jgi:hypothetical protein
MAALPVFDSPVGEFTTIVKARGIPLVSTAVVASPHLRQT